jgi:predicted metallo-beta-lactamase superfamily hydrolase
VRPSLSLIESLSQSNFHFFSFLDACVRQRDGNKNKATVSHDKYLLLISRWNLFVILLSYSTSDEIGQWNKMGCILCLLWGHKSSTLVYCSGIQTNYWWGGLKKVKKNRPSVLTISQRFRTCYYYYYYQEKENKKGVSRGYAQHAN